MSGFSNMNDTSVINKEHKKRKTPGKKKKSAADIPNYLAARTDYCKRRKDELVNEATALKTTFSAKDAAGRLEELRDLEEERAALDKKIKDCDALVQKDFKSRPYKSRMPSSAYWKARLGSMRTKNNST